MSQNSSAHFEINALSARLMSQRALTTTRMLMTHHTNHCLKFYCSKFHCSKFHCSKFHCSKFHCLKFHCPKFHCSKFCYSTYRFLRFTVQSLTVQSFAIQRTAVQRTTVQRTTRPNPYPYPNSGTLNSLRHTLWSKGVDIQSTISWRCILLMGGGDG